MLYRHAFFIEQVDTLIRRLKTSEHSSIEEKAAVKENIRVLDSFLAAGKPAVTNDCREENCYLYVEIIKSRQMLFLYLDGELKDSFAVSTGIKNYQTPEFNVKPSGPIFSRYTSRKFPGGNYKGLGNMPYAVFVKGGYAIHGTTQGNIPFLGREASHGCIRLHPDNARVFYELVKLVGLFDTWVKVTDWQHRSQQNVRLCYQQSTIIQLICIQRFHQKALQPNPNWKTLYGQKQPNFSDCTRKLLDVRSF